MGVFPTWLNDSRRLLYAAPQGALNVVDTESGLAHEILSLFPDTVVLANQSPDGQSLYLNRQSAEADIWMLTLDTGR